MLLEHALETSTSLCRRKCTWRITLVSKSFRVIQDQISQSSLQEGSFLAHRTLIASIQFFTGVLLWASLAFRPEGL